MAITLYCPPHSPDLASSDSHLFRSLSNSLGGMLFNDDIALQNWLHFKPPDLSSRGEEELLNRWEAIANNGEEYIFGSCTLFLYLVY